MRRIHPRPAPVPIIDKESFTAKKKSFEALSVSFVDNTV